jgi:hypothetical protein
MVMKNSYEGFCYLQVLPDIGDLCTKRCFPVGTGVYTTFRPNLVNESERAVETAMTCFWGRGLIMRWAQGVPAYIIQVPVCFGVVGSPLVFGSKGHIIIQ